MDQSATQSTQISPTPPTPSPRAPDEVSAMIAMAASGGAALVHAAIATAHGASGGWFGGTAFLAASAAQLAVPMVAVARGGHWWKAVAAVNLAAVAAYVAAVLGAAPAMHAGPEPISVLGLVTVALELVAAAMALRRPAVPAGSPGSATVVGSVAMIVAAVAAVGLAPPHHAAGDGHGQTAQNHGHADESHGAAGSVSPADQAKADALIADTASALTRYPDVAAAEAAGYKWIGDGDRPGGYRHYVSGARTLDATVLDPAEVESLVYRTEPGGGLTLVSAMFILPPGRTMTDVPDVAGELTRWHDHTFCRGGPRRLMEADAAGACPPGSRPWQSPPMLHVWIVDHPGGPFGEIDGHGDDHHEGSDGG